MPMRTMPNWIDRGLAWEAGRERGADAGICNSSPCSITSPIMRAPPDIRIEITSIRKGYKHVDRSVAQQVQDGSVKLGTYESYRSGEGPRVDKLEGATFARMGTFRQGMGISSKDNDALRNMGIYVGPECRGNVISDNSHLIELPPAYIFCCSKEPDFELAERQGQAIFEIANLSAFADEVTRASSDVLGKRYLGSVRYKVRSGDPFKIGPIYPDPFIKAPRFAFEKELRIVWPLAEKPAEESMILNVPAVSRLLQRIFSTTRAPNRRTGLLKLD